MGDRKAALEEANKVLEEYRKSINKYLTWVWEKPERLRELDNIYVVNGEDFVSEKIIGTISSHTHDKPAKRRETAHRLRKRAQRRLSENFCTNHRPWRPQRRQPGRSHARSRRKIRQAKAADTTSPQADKCPLDKVDEFVKIANELVGNS